MRLAAATALMMGLLCPVAPAVAADPASVEWNGKRADLWVALCPASAPNFRDFDARARRSGFVFKPETGFYSYGKSEIVASLKEHDGHCECRFTFGSDATELAVRLVIARMLKAYGSRFRPDENPLSLGELVTSAGPIPITAVRFPNAGSMWVGLIAKAPRPCPPARPTATVKNASPPIR